ncbi:MAG: serine/threonine-protein kinase [Myxococcota bacterium]
MQEGPTRQTSPPTRSSATHVAAPAAPASEPLPRSTALEVPDSTATDPLAGTGYRALKRIGKGGFGEAWIAVHEAIGHRVVCKLLHQRHVGDAQKLERLRLEAETSARNPHPHLVNIFDLRTTSDGRPFVVMEYIDGPSLRRLLKHEYNHGPLPLRMAVEVTRQILLALRQLHGSGVAHRDLKPDNVMIAAREPALVVKVIDLGLAKVFDPGDESAAAHAGTPRPLAIPTQSMELAGTPRYMAPEQIDRSPSAPIDHRVDLWALGVIMMKLLTGRPPFGDRKTFEEICFATLLDPVETPSSLVSEPLPRGLDEVILRALEKRPSDRYASADAMLAALDAIDLNAVAPAFTTIPIQPPLSVDEVGWLAAPLGSTPPPRGTTPIVPPTEPMAPIDARGFTEALPASRRAEIWEAQRNAALEQARREGLPLPLEYVAPRLANQMIERREARMAAEAAQSGPAEPAVMPWSRFFLILGTVALACVMTAVAVLAWGGHL